MTLLHEAFIALFFAALLVILYLQMTRKRLQEMKRITSLLNRATDFKAVIELLTQEARRKKSSVLAFYRKRIPDVTLTSADGSVSILEESAPTKAFLTCSVQTPKSARKSDQTLIEKYGQDVTFVPVAMLKTENCWKVNDCGHTECPCFGIETKECWLKSGRKFRGRKTASYKEKMSKCIRCKAFLPIGVFAVRGGRPAKLASYIEAHFSGAIRTAVLRHRSEDGTSFDTLTGLLNRRTLDLLLDVLYRQATRYRHPLSLAIIDIDRFKHLNDARGRQAGDKLLIEFACFISGAISESEIVGRYGGDEFIVIYANTEKAAALTAAEKLLKSISQRPFHGDRHITVSIGLAGYPDDPSKNPVQLVEMANRALDRAKTKKDEVIVFSEKCKPTPKSKDDQEAPQSQSPPVNSRRKRLSRSPDATLVNKEEDGGYGN
jgi:diguanylate cyclase (GGDEF)-like protein